MQASDTVITQGSETTNQYQLLWGTTEEVVLAEADLQIPLLIRIETLGDKKDRKERKFSTKLEWEVFWVIELRHFINQD